MAILDWSRVPGVPHYCSAILASLRFGELPFASFPSLGDADWKAALRFCDRSQLTLVLGGRHGATLPPWVRDRIHGNLKGNRQRLDRLRQEYALIRNRFEDAGVEHVVLKGFTHAQRFVQAAAYRPQSDLDLLVAEADLGRAQQILLELGFESSGLDGDFPTDHLPPFVRKTGWRWSGDFFDPGIPAVVELHYRLWDARTEGFPVEGLEQLPQRRKTLLQDGQPMPSFQPADQLGYACLHVLRHLLRGDLKAFHVYEVAYFLERHVDQQRLWQEWKRTHSASLRQLGAISCYLARVWFGCRLPPQIQEERLQLSPRVMAWFATHAAAPVAALFRPNKDELWLHFELVLRTRDRLRILRRRLVPATLPGHVEATFVSAEQLTGTLRLRKWASYSGFLLSRFVFHLHAGASTMRSAFTWWWKGTGRGKAREVRLEKGADAS